MNRIQRIQNFVKDYKTLDPYFKNLTKDSYDHYQLELMNQYIHLSKHPLPQEYLNSN
jgi:hypothetical protein